jgi:hypothetical protein
VRRKRRHNTGSHGDNFGSSRFRLHRQLGASRGQYHTNYETHPRLNRKAFGTTDGCGTKDFAGGLVTGTTTSGIEDYEAAARSLKKITIQPLRLSEPNRDLEGAFQAAVNGRINAIITICDAVPASYMKRIANLTFQQRLPSMTEDTPYVEAGGLMSYSANNADQFKRAAIYVDKILKGIKPAELPAEQPAKFALVVNLKTAKQIGLTIPPNVLARADRVIK